MDALTGPVLEALRLASWLAAPTLLAVLAAGVAVGLLQAVTQVQDSALGFVPRLLAAGLALAATAVWMSNQLVGFTQRLWQQLAALAT